MTCSDLDLERQVLSTLIGWNENCGRRLNPADLSTDLHQAVAIAAYSLQDSGKKVNILSVLDALERSGTNTQGYDDLAGIPYVTALWDDAVARLHDLARARRLREASFRAAQACEEGRPDEARTLLAVATDAAQSGAQGPQSVDAKATVRQAVEAALDRANDRKVEVRLGMPLLDRTVGGLPPGSMTVIGGRTGAGKSSLALVSALYQSRAGRKPGILALEDPPAVWGSRLLAHLVGLSSVKQHRGSLTPSDFDRLNRAPDQAEQIAVEFCYEIGSEADRVCDAARFLVTERRCDSLIVDYVQAARVDAGRGRYDKAMADVAKRLKGIAHRAGVPLILLSQLGRPPKDKPYTEPHMSDLKETGDLENEAEVILLLWQDSGEEDANILGKIAKLKWGPAGWAFQLERSPASGAIVGVVERDLVY